MFKHELAHYQVDGIVVTKRQRLGQVCVVDVDRLVGEPLTCLLNRRLGSVDCDDLAGLLDKELRVVTGPTSRFEYAQTIEVR